MDRRDTVTRADVEAGRRPGLPTSHRRTTRLTLSLEREDMEQLTRYREKLRGESTTGEVEWWKRHALQRDADTPAAAARRLLRWALAVELGGKQVPLRGKAKGKRGAR